MEVVLHLKMELGTLGTSFTNFGTSLKKFDTFLNLVHPIVELLGPLSYYPWFVYSFGDLWELIGGDSLLQNRLWNPRYILEKFDTSNP